MNGNTRRRAKAAPPDPAIVDVTLRASRIVLAFRRRLASATRTYEATSAEFVKSMGLGITFRSLLPSLGVKLTVEEAAVECWRDALAELESGQGAFRDRLGRLDADIHEALVDLASHASWEIQSANPVAVLFESRRAASRGRTLASIAAELRYHLKPSVSIVDDLASPPSGPDPGP